MRKPLSLKAMLLTLAVIWVIVARMPSECGLVRDGGGKIRDLGLVVVDEADIPEELRGIIAEKKTQPFRLAYSNNESLYIVVDYDPQNTGGYSIAVKELYLINNSIVMDMEPIDPAKGGNPTAETPYPYAVVRTEYLGNPVVFQ